ncbi:MAG: heme-copper oxidase subunit III [Proteobacteria bacterium]|nr:heme-copper oxidase subunit III [Pseudomonadota bacterium]
MADVLVPAKPLPVAPQGQRASGWYGLMFLIATEAALFVYLLFSYFFLASQAPGAWPPSGAPPILVSAINTGVLLASSVTAWWGQKGIEKGQTGRLILGLSLSLILGAVFAGVQAHEWLNKPFTPKTDAYGSLYFTITGVHIAHVLVGLLILACLIVWAAMGRFDARRHLHVTLGVLYWHFVDAVWLVVFTTFFITPRLG